MLWSEQTIEDIYKIIGERLHARRTALGITQTGLGQAVSLTRSSIANIEAGRQRAMIHTVMQIANHLDIELYELFPVAENSRTDQQFGKQLEGQPDSTQDFVHSVIKRLSR